MLFSCGPVRLPGPDSYKMLLSSEIFCGDDDKNLAVWTGLGVWRSSWRCSKYWRLIFGRQLYTVSPVSVSLTMSSSGEIGEGTYCDSVLHLCAYSLVRVYFVTHPLCLGCLQTIL